MMNQCPKDNESKGDFGENNGSSDVFYEADLDSEVEDTTVSGQSRHRRLTRKVQFWKSFKAGRCPIRVKRHATPEEFPPVVFLKLPPLVTMKEAEIMCSNTKPIWIVQSESTSNNLSDSLCFGEVLSNDIEPNDNVSISSDLLSSSPFRGQEKATVISGSPCMEPPLDSSKKLETLDKQLQK